MGKAAGNLLDYLVAEAKKRHVATIHLDTSELGRHLYAKYGFVPSEAEMHLPAEPV